MRKLLATEGETLEFVGVFGGVVVRGRTNLCLVWIFWNWVALDGCSVNARWWCECCQVAWNVN